MNKNLIVQLWGLGNLVQTEPLMRYLGKGDILVDPNRSTDQLAPFFPDWAFKTPSDMQGVSNQPYDDVYLCWPVGAKQFAGLGNRIHTPTWSFGQWRDPEWRVLLEMHDDRYSITLDSGEQWKVASPPQLRPPVGPEHPKHIAVSIGYLKSEEGWGFKHWGNDQFVRLFKHLIKREYVPVLLGDQRDWDTDGIQITRQVLGKMVVLAGNVSLWEQCQYLAGCDGYIGNDTGMAHVAGALGLPSAIYTVTDRIKNRTSAPDLNQFDKAETPEEIGDWLLEGIENGKEVAQSSQGQEDS